MATPKINENCHYVQNDRHKFKIKVGKFHSDILCHFGVIKESAPPPPPPGEIVLSHKFCVFFQNLAEGKIKG